MSQRLKLPSIHRLAHFGLDGGMAWFACAIAYWIRFEGTVEPTHQLLAWVLPLVAMPGRLTTQTLFGLYRQVWRLFCLRDLIRLVKAVTFYSLLILVVTRLFLPRVGLLATGIPLSVAVIDWSFCLMGMVVLRYARRRSVQEPFWQRRVQRHNRQRVLLIGAGQAGSLVVEESRYNREIALDIVGFLDDDPTKIGRMVAGVKVLGSTAQLVAIAQYHGVNELLITIPSATPVQIRHILDRARQTDLRLKILPGHAELLRDRSLFPQARDIQIQDILGRPEIRLDFAQDFDPQFPAASEQVYHQTVLVTGAGGTIGAEICRQLARLAPQTLLLLGRGENSIFHIEQELKQDFPHLHTQAVIADIRHTERLERIFATWQPNLVFHAAAHKHVPLMQMNPTEALANNAIASAQLADLASRYQVATMVMISTDKAVEPSNFMGLSKRLAELFIRAIAPQSQTRFLVVRFGNVLGSRGSVVPIFKAQIAQGGPVTVTDLEMTRYFMTTPEASQLVIQSLAVGKSGQILILDMGEPIRIYDLAEQMIYLAGCKPGIDIPIVITGLRPGEKLHEALFSASETLSPTAHPKIRVVQNALGLPWGSPIAPQPHIPPAQRQQVLSELQCALGQDLSTAELWELAQRCCQSLEAGSTLPH